MSLQAVSMRRKRQIICHLQQDTNHSDAKFYALHRISDVQS